MGQSVQQSADVDDNKIRRLDRYSGGRSGIRVVRARRIFPCAVESKRQTKGELINQFNYVLLTATADTNCEAPSSIQFTERSAHKTLAVCCETRHTIRPCTTHARLHTRRGVGVSGPFSVDALPWIRGTSRYQIIRRQLCEQGSRSSDMRSGEGRERCQRGELSEKRQASFQLCQMVSFTRVCASRFTRQIDSLVHSMFFLPMRQRNASAQKSRSARGMIDSELGVLPP
ncbi:hypothetical protein B0H12DRAFT_1165752 [Mycena haematopus]|nr:hypothetical protein B0H12DRAFT_1165752 [Mycena haematopus]